METKRGTVTNFREHVHRVGENGAFGAYESVFYIQGQPVRLTWHTPALIVDGDDVQVQGQIRDQFLLAERYTNYTKSIQGKGRRWVSMPRRLLFTCLVAVVALAGLLVVLGVVGVLAAALS